MQLLLSALGAAHAGPLHLDLGHVGIYRALARAAGLDGSGEDNDAELFAALRDKDAAAVHEQTSALPEPARGALRALAGLYGPAAETLSAARGALPALPDVTAALEALAVLASAATGVDAIHVDLADLRGYHYYTGATFAVFAEGGAARSRIADAAAATTALAAPSGARARPPAFRWTCGALRHSPATVAAGGSSWHPTSGPRLARTIAALRTNGEAVAVALPGESLERGHRIVGKRGEWRVEEK